MHNNRTVAIIPARGGSKGIPGKNVIDMAGKPLVAWSIIQARMTPEIDAVYVTSDHDEILAVAKKYGAVPIRRPDAIAGDHASSESALRHALEHIDTSEELVVMLQPTSPLRKPDDIGKAIRQFKAQGCDSLFSGAELEDFLIWEKDADALQSMNYDYRNRKRRQERKAEFVENGSLYVFRSDLLMKENNRLGGSIGIYLMEFWQTFEIDTPSDLELVRTLFDMRLKSTYDQLMLPKK